MTNLPLKKEHLLVREKIRSQIRQHRRSLSEEKQKSAAQSVYQHLLTHQKIALAKHIGIFLSFDGEICTRPIIQHLWQQHKKVYVPIASPIVTGNLLFVPYDENTPLISNRWNIREPRLDMTQVIPIKKLDILFVPLVAFDEHGQRLGMGGGFYDRILEKNPSTGLFPIGLAHDFQQVHDLPIAQWDISLPEIITPSKIWHWPSLNDEKRS